MSIPLKRYLTVREGENVWFVERLEDPTGVAFQAYTVFATFDTRIYERGATDPNTAVYSSLAAVHATPPLYDTLQTDGYWGGQDSTGYNFRYALLPATYALKGGKLYDVEFTFYGTFGGLAITRRAIFQVSTITVGSV